MMLPNVSKITATQIREITLFLFVLVGLLTNCANARSYCTVQQSNGALVVTPDCVDPLYANPVIDEETELTGSIPYRLISGHFSNTTVKFNIYLPPASRWEGRFFQEFYPTSDENAEEDMVNFGFEHGAYTVQASGTSGYRHYAAAAQFSRAVATKYYHFQPSRHIYGYAFGGSGGSYQVIGAIENTYGIWDGVVPYVQAVPGSIPDVPGSRTLAGLVLRSRRAKIADAVQPGGSGDPFASLNMTERAMLHEITTLGLPLRKWEDFAKTADGYTISVLAPTIQALDPTYSEDFWTKVGYLGTEESELGSIIRSIAVETNVSIASLHRNASGSLTGVVLAGLPNITDTYGCGEPTGADNIQAILDALTVGGIMQVDNRWYVAAHAYYRYKLPSLPGFYEFNQFLSSRGQPLYPQREVDVPVLVATGVSGGANYSGNITAKMVVIDNLWDSDAWACHADWYRWRVQDALGPRFEENYRLYYNDHADHNFGAVDPPRTAYLVDYTPIVMQALLDVSQWAEKGVMPPQSTEYEISDSQIVVSSVAAERKGIQPVVQVTANGGIVARVAAGSIVLLSGKVEVPPGAGMVSTAEWDPLGVGVFTTTGLQEPNETVELDLRYTYSSPGTYFPGLRAASQREGAGNSTSPKVANIGRARVIVY